MSKTKYGPCAVPGWERKLKAGKSILPDPKRLPFWSQAAGDAGWSLFSDFRLTDVAGAPKVGPISPPWLQGLVKYWLGAQDPATGARSVQEMLLLTSKKSTKTSSMALLTLAQFVSTRKPNSQAIIIAPTLNVADMAFRLIQGAIESTPGLKECYKILEANKEVKDVRPGWNTQLKVAAADLGVLVGTKAEFIMLDEIHVLAAKNGAQYLMEHVRGARAAQPSASCIICTTHPHEPQPGLWEEMLGAYRNIRDNESQTRRLFVSYEFPESFYAKKKYLDPKHWHMVNPSIGYSTTLEDMVDDHKAAVEEGPASAASFANQRLNVDPAQIQTPNNWSGAESWDNSLHEDPTLGDPTIRGLDALLRYSEAVVVGIDGGGLYDFLSLYVIGREPNRERWLGWGHSWLHEGVRERRPAFWDVAQRFVALGEVSVVDYSKTAPWSKRSINLHEMSQLVSYIHASGRMLEKGAVGIDPGGLPVLADSLHDPTMAMPLPAHKVMRIPQGTALAPTIEGLGQRVLQGNFVHGGQRIMSWAVQNVECVPTANSFKVQKEGLSEKKKIDPFIAMACAARLLEVSPASIVGINIKRAA